MNRKDKEFATTYIMNVLHRIKYSRTAKKQIDELLKEYWTEYTWYRRRKLHSAQHFLILWDEKTAREMCMKMRDKPKTNTSL